MAGLSEVQQAVQSIGATTGAKNLTARANGGAIEIHGTVHSIAEKQNIMHAITEKVGNVGLVNHIQVAAEPARQQQPVPHAPAAQPQQPQQQQQAPAAQPQQQQQAAQPQQAARTHHVKKGETLSHIAKQYYGNANDYRRIFEANRDQLNDPDKIREGMTLRIP